MKKTSIAKQPTAQPERQRAAPLPRAEAAAASHAPPYGIDLADSAAPPLVYDVLRAPGKPLDAGVRASFEAQLGRDLGDVRVHVDDRAAASARALDAPAYSVGAHAVFDRGAYNPETADGRALLAHELRHVAQTGAAPIGGPLVVGGRHTAAEREAAQGGRVVERVATNVIQRAPKKTAAQLAAVEAEAVARDYTDAQDYVTDFYSTAAAVHRAMVSASHRSINRFTETSQILDSRLAANVTYQLVRIVLGILPGAKGVVELFDALRAGTSIAANGARLATIAATIAQRSAAGVSTAVVPGTGNERREAVHALDTLTAFDTDGAQRIETERAMSRTAVEALGRDPVNRHQMRAVAESLLGPAPVLVATDLRRFEAEYELRLYAAYYQVHGRIVRSTPTSLLRVYTDYRIYDIPEAVQARVRELFRALGRVPRVAIDLRFLGGTTFSSTYGESLKCLIDLDIPVVSPAYGGTPRPVTFHTGSDLQMPYRGDRFQEVR